jgi:Ran GTPase-activating protein (RanGAP) involved in mRNA processing and transport
MKTAQKIPSEITAPTYAAITEKGQSSSSSTQETLLDETTETTPLYPRQLQQLLQQLNWQEQDLTTAGISSTLLTEEFNRSWYSRLNHWFLREPLLFKILQWPFSKKWPIGSAFPTNDERLLERMYGVNGYLEGTDLMLNKVWSSLLLSFLIVDIANYYLYPNLRYGNTLLKVFLAQTDNQQMLSNVLTLPEAWPILLGTPILWGILKAFLSTRHAKALDKATYRTLLETLGHYQASLWKDIGRWVLPSLLPEFVPNLALFALLPKPKLKLALESAERLLLWDRRISPNERRILLQQVQVLARKATHMTQLKALATLAKVADGIAPNDLVRLSQQEVDAETVKSLLSIKQQAKQTLQQVAQNPSAHLMSSVEMISLINTPLIDNKFATPSRSRYIYSHYLLWTLGQPHDYRLQPLFWSYLAFQGYFKARFFYLLGRGMYDTLKYYWNKWLCESEGKLWSYFNERAMWECSVCGDLPIFYPDTFTDKNCLEAYLKNPQQALDVIKLIQRLDWQRIDTLDFSNQIKWSESDWVDVFSNLTDRAKQVRVLFASSATRSNALPFTTWVVQAITSFLNHSSITFLSLDYRTIGDKGIKTLTSILPYSKVQTLNLKSNNISDEGAKTLAQFLYQSPAQTLSLDLENNNIGPEGASALAQSLNQSQVQTLSLDNNRIGAKGASVLAQSLNQSQIQTLSLWSNNIGDEGASALAQSLKQSQIHTLYLGDNHIGAKGARALALHLSQSQVQILTFDDNNIGIEGASAFAQSLNQSQVRILSLWNSNIGDEGTSALAQSLNQSQVEILYLGSNNIGDEGVIVLALSLNKSQVKTLSLNKNNMSAKGASALAQSLNKSQVKTLSLNRNNIGAEGAKVLAQFLKQSQVQTLDLWSNRIGPEGASALAQSLNQSQVKTLILDGNNIGDDGLSVLAQFLNRSLVQTLSLNSNDISVKGARVLAQSLGQSLVQTLYLSNNNNISAAGVKALAQFLSQSLVQTLYLHGNNIDDEGIIALAKGLVTTQINFDLSAFLTPDAKKALARTNANTPLETLNLENNKITTTGATALCRILPQTKITVTHLNLNTNPINSSQVDPQTCFISSSAALLQPTGSYVMLYHYYQAILHYAMEITTRWLTTPVSLSLTHNKAQEQSSSSLDSVSTTIEKVLFDSPNFLAEEITINESPVISDALSEKNEHGPLFTFKITSLEPAMTTIPSSLLEPNRPSKNPFGFFNGPAKTSPPATTQPLNLSALPKPAETLSTTTAIGAVGTAVTGFLAVGYWAWKNIRRNKTNATISEKAAHSEPEVKMPKSVF